MNPVHGSLRAGPQVRGRHGKTVENEALARRWFEEVWNGRRTDTIDELLTDESVSHTASGSLRGKQEFKERAHAVFLSAFPDLRMTVEGTVAEGNEVVVR